MNTRPLNSVQTLKSDICIENIYIYTYISVNKLFIVKKFLILLYLVVLSSIVTWILLKMKLFQTFFKLPSFENFCVFNLEACGICHRFYLNFKNNVLSPHVLHLGSRGGGAPSRSMFTIPVENPVTWPVLFETPFFRYLSLCLQVRSENFS